MKKIITIAVLAATFASSSVFGQGYFKLSTGKSQVWDGFSTAGVSARNTTVNVALFWAPASTASPVASYLANTPTTGTNGLVESYTAAQAWAAILGSTFTLAQTTDAGLNGTVMGLSSATGVVQFGTGANLGIAGTTASSIVTLMLVSWSSAYATPQLAQTGTGGIAGAIGWSAPIQYTLGTSLVDNGVTSPTFSQFGTFAPGAVPEPGTMALAALGGASLLLFRRRK